MRRARAAEGHHGVAPRVTPLLDQVHARRTGHRLADHGVDAPGGLDRRQPEPRTEPRQCRLRRIAVERHRPAEEEARIVVAQQQVRIGDGRVRPAAPVARGPRIGTRRMRADLDQPRLVHAGDGPAPGADLDHVDDRRADRQAGAALEAMDARGLHHRGDLRAAVLDQAGLGGGAAHVEGERVRQAGGTREKHRRQGAAGRPGFQQPDREGARHLGRAEPAIGLHQAQRAAEAQRIELADQPPEVAVHQRLHEGIGAGGDAALVFADLGRDLARQADRHIREGRAQQRRRGLLMGRVGIAVQEADRDRGAAFRHEPRAGIAHLRRVERCDYLAAMGDPLADLDPAAPRHDGVGKAEEQVVDVVALLDPEFEHVAEAARRQQARRGAAAFDQRVGHERRAVQDLGELRDRDAGLRDHRRDAGQGAFRRVLRRREALMQGYGACRGVQQHEVREGAADVEAETVAWRGCGHRALLLPCAGEGYRRPAGAARLAPAGVPSAGPENPGP